MGVVTSYAKRNLLVAFKYCVFVVYIGIAFIETIQSLTSSAFTLSICVFASEFWRSDIVWFENRVWLEVGCYCWFARFVTAAMLVVKNKKHFSPLGTELYFQVNSLRYISIVWTPTLLPCMWLQTKNTFYHRLRTIEKIINTNRKMLKMRSECLNYVGRT